ncbi:hypothetical protein SS50377_27237 [Spironucleus salmonicida]|uniref:Uncharacterized protein n=1 Tax=Spironucleus salmonicida TaxID=348837 RepID=V6LU58_9EUKA|nr:hypothetical protein SS50377_27237 [Spironucleus salmonicida]|eukprot:EST44334.1 Hypothetical protein SS50377_15873 [Spironucleus salmonicida]
MKGKSHFCSGKLLRVASSSSRIKLNLLSKSTYIEKTPIVYTQFFLDDISTLVITTDSEEYAVK